MAFQLLKWTNRPRFFLVFCLFLWGSVVVSEWACSQEKDVLSGDQQVTRGADPLSGSVQPSPRGVDPPSTPSEGANRLPTNPFRRPNEFSNEPIPPSPNRLSPNTPARQQPRTRVTPTSRSSRSNRQNNNPFSPRLARVPYIMGDFFGRGYTTASIQVQGITNPVDFELPNPSAGDVVGRVRLQDNNSPLPRDRVFLDYSFFHNVPLTSSGIDVNRFTPGIEKTFFGGLASLELRIPMAVTLNSNIVTDLPDDSSYTEFGNITIAPKFLLASTSEMALAAGLGVSIATADDLEVSLADGTKLLTVSNESVHLIPYLALLYAPKQSNFFAQAFLSYDFDTNGNSVYSNVNGSGQERLGIWQDQNLAALSLSAGSWLHRDYCHNRRLKSVSWSAEVHYTATINDADYLMVGNNTVGNRSDDLSLVNGAIGVHTRIGKTKFTVGYATPFTSSDRVFDGELRFFANRFF